MKIVLSRKGFDSGAGGAPSPIVNGRPVSLPIPTRRYPSETTYEDLGLGDLVERQTGGRISRRDFCHADPAFQDGLCAFGQTGRAQSHLRNEGVGVGSVFLFFGLFLNPDSGAREHWLFGYLRVREVVALGDVPDADRSPAWLRYVHPHVLGRWEANNTLYLGEGRTARRTSPCLRLTVPGSRVSRWRVPRWLKDCGLSHHKDAARWSEGGILNAVSRGQEFVCDITASEPQAREWVETVIERIEA